MLLSALIEPFNAAWSLIICFAFFGFNTEIKIIYLIWNCSVKSSEKLISKTIPDLSLSRTRRKVSSDVVILG